MKKTTMQYLIRHQEHMVNESKRYKKLNTSDYNFAGKENNLKEADEKIKFHQGVLKELEELVTREIFDDED